MLGWAGSALVLAAYAGSSLGWVSVDAPPFKIMNLAGAAGLATNGWAHRAWPVLGLEGAWAVIALVTLLVPRRRGAIAPK